MSDWLTYNGLTRQDFGKRLAWSRAPAIIVLHSTEGGGYPGYFGGGDAPHFTIDCRGRTARQHVPLTSAARALKASGLGHTNTGGAVQIEIIGTCAVGGKPSVLDLDDAALGYLVGLLKAIAAATGIPLTTSVTWSGYPASYGETPRRLGWAAWADYRGVLGHQHVPGNVHGDPGSLNVSRLLTLARPAPAPTPKPVTRDWFDMATEAQLQKIVADQIKHTDDAVIQLRRAVLTESGPGSGEFSTSGLEQRIVAAVVAALKPAA
jgi:hypothetical protein